MRKGQRVHYRGQTGTVMEAKHVTPGMIDLRMDGEDFNRRAARAEVARVNAGADKWKQFFEGAADPSELTLGNLKKAAQALGIKGYSDLRASEKRRRKELEERVWLAAEARFEAAKARAGKPRTPKAPPARPAPRRATPEIARLLSRARSLGIPWEQAKQMSAEELRAEVTRRFRAQYGTGAAAPPAGTQLPPRWWEEAARAVGQGRGAKGRLKKLEQLRAHLQQHPLSPDQVARVEQLAPTVELIETFHANVVPAAVPAAPSVKFERPIGAPQIEFDPTKPLGIRRSPGLGGEWKEDAWGPEPKEVPKYTSGEEKPLEVQVAELADKIGIRFDPEAAQATYRRAYGDNWEAAYRKSLAERKARFEKLYKAQISHARVAAQYKPPTEQMMGSITGKDSALRRAGAGVFMRPDPPRFGKGRAYCGNPIDGTAYYFVVAGRRNTAPNFLTWADLYTAAVASADRKLARKESDALAPLVQPETSAVRVLKTPWDADGLVYGMLQGYAHAYGQWSDVVVDMVRAGIETDAGVLAGIEHKPLRGGTWKLLSFYGQQQQVPAGRVRITLPPRELLDQLVSYYDKHFAPMLRARDHKIVLVKPKHRGQARIGTSAKKRKARGKQIHAKYLEGAGKGKPVTYEATGGNFTFFEKGQQVYPKVTAAPEDQMRAFQPFGGKRKGDRHSWRVTEQGTALDALLELSARRGPAVSLDVAEMLFASGMVQVARTELATERDKRDRRFTMVVLPDTPVQPGDRLYVWQPEKGASPYFSWVQAMIPVPKGLFDPCLSEEDEAVRIRMNEVVKGMGEFKNALVSIHTFFRKQLASGVVPEKMFVDEKLKKLARGLRAVSRQRLRIEEDMYEGTPGEQEVALRCARFLGWRYQPGATPPPLALFRLGVEEDPVPETESLLARALVYAHKVGLLRKSVDASGELQVLHTVGDLGALKVFYDKLDAATVERSTVDAPALKFLSPQRYGIAPQTGLGAKLVAGGAVPAIGVHPLDGVYQLLAQRTDDFAGVTIEEGGDRFPAALMLGQLRTLADLSALRDRSASPPASDRSAAAEKRRFAWRYGKHLRELVWGPRAAKMRPEPSAESRDFLATLSLLMTDVLAERRRIAPSEGGGVDDELRKLLLLSRVYYGVSGYRLVGPLLYGPQPSQSLLEASIAKLQKQVENYLSSSLRSMEQGITVYKTYNPVLFEMTRLYWPTRHAADRNWRGLLSQPKVLADVDVVGRYGYLAQLMQEYIPDTTDEMDLANLLWSAILLPVEFYATVVPVRGPAGLLDRVLFPPARRMGQVIGTKSRKLAAEVLDRGYGVDIADPEEVRDAVPQVLTALRHFNSLWPLGQQLDEGFATTTELLKRPTHGLQQLKAAAITAFPRLLTVRQAGLPAKRRGLAEQPWVQQLFRGEADPIKPGAPLDDEQEEALAALRHQLQRAMGVELFAGDSDEELAEKSPELLKQRRKAEEAALREFQARPPKIRRRTSSGDMALVPLKRMTLKDRITGAFRTTGLYDKPTVEALLAVEASPDQPPGTKVGPDGTTNTPWLLRQRTGKQMGKSYEDTGPQPDIWRESALTSTAIGAQSPEGSAAGWVKRLDGLIGALDEALGIGT